MAIRIKNPYNEEKRKIAKRTDLSEDEKEKLISELDFKSSKWIAEKLRELYGKKEEQKDFITKTKQEFRKVEKKTLRHLYKQTIDRSRELMALYKDMRQLNKEVRELLTK